MLDFCMTIGVTRHVHIYTHTDVTHMTVDGLHEEVRLHEKTTENKEDKDLFWFWCGKII